MSQEPPLRDAVLRSLFHPSVAVACEDLETFADVGPLGEEAWLLSAAPARRRELAAGRACAARALALLGSAGTSVGRGVQGEPIWPTGMVGSIAHAERLCVAVAAPASEVLAIGVDVEPDRPESLAFAKRVCSAAERAALAALPGGLESLAPVVFSAKEASYKLQFPLTGDTGCWSNIEVLLTADEFCVRYHGAAAGLRENVLRGRWRRASGFIWTGVAVRQSSRV